MPSRGKTNAPKEILDLVARFEQQLDAYKSGQYNETQLRREFLDPFVKSLGWDVDNEKGHAEAYKDVVHEDAIRVGDSNKAPDYCFRIGGTRKFFLEAKKPSVLIKQEIAPAYQLRSYAWSAKLPLSILSDFEEFAIYDCRIKPARDDSAATARIFYCTFQEYAEKWDEIASVFSREAVLKGSFDRFAESTRAKKGTAEFDADFLATIEGWRKEFAQNLALRNPKLTQRELNFAVQRIIDRVIFLRICEARGLEDYGRLRALLNGDRIYPRLIKLFEEADARYNSGLFHFKKEAGRHEDPDELTPGLEIDDKLLRNILRGLYYPDSPYRFSVIPADILGQVYEQFLGKIIRLTPGHRAEVDDKPEVKKAGGVYYTPTYIVDYIVRQTVGKLVEGNTPKQVQKIKVLDPACGSGSFLIGAYQFLLDWHLQFYTARQPEKWAKGRKPTLVQTGKGWKLTIAERKRILLNNIYGVDIDTQAVEVTKLSLLLKVLEGETGQTLQTIFRLFQERALPDLGDNIKCGNSLIGPDFYQQSELPLLTDDEKYRINVFDWHAEFPEIFKAGGFDAVIGNPPYVRQESLASFKDYFEQNYEASDGVADLYTYFMEKGINLLRDGGLFSIIVSSSFLRATYGEPLRRTLKRNAAVVRIVDFGGLAVFANAKDTYVCVPLLAKGEKQSRVEVSKVISLKNLKLVEHVASNHFTIPHERLSPEAWSLKSDAEASVFAKVLKAGKPLGEFVERRFFRGVTSGLNEAFVIDTETKRKLIAKHKRSAELIHPLLGGEEIRRYIFNETGLWLIFTRRGVDIEKYPAIRAHLEQWKEDLMPKRSKSAKRGRKPGRYEWYEIQDDVAYYEVFDGPKIIFPDICKGPRFSLDTSDHYLANTAYCLGTDNLYLLGVLNSRLFWFAISNISIPFGIRAGEYRYRLIYQYMEKVPVRVINPSDKADKAAHDRMVKLVELMLALHRQLAAARTPQEKSALERQIAATDTQIDRLVYDLYGLTEAEIKIVEGANK
jgi:Eco57I restriction-modification methylase/restriction endonuclease TaqI-like protein